MLKIIFILGPGAALIHLAWLASFWMSRGITWATFVSGVVDVCLLMLTAGSAVEIIKERLEIKPKQRIR